MTIASEIQRIKTNIANAYTACDNKGATMPATQNSNNLASCVSSIPTATEPTLASLTVTPSTTAQTLTPPSGTDGYNTVKVNAVTSAIDSDIQAGNIKSGVNILGVTGTVTALAGETRTVSITSTSGNTFTPSSGKNGITSIKCNPTNKALTITPTTTTQTFTVPTNYSGYGTVTCSAGTQPSGTYTITANGTYDVTNYASADVSVSGGGDGWQTITDITFHLGGSFDLESLYAVKYKILDLKRTGEEEYDIYQVIAIPLDENGNVLHKDDDGGLLYLSYDMSFWEDGGTYIYITFCNSVGDENIIRVRK